MQTTPDTTGFQKLKADLDKKFQIKEYERRLKGLKDFCGIIDNGHSQPVEKIKKGAFGPLVLTACKKLTGTFTVGDVHDEILKLNPAFPKKRGAISNILKQLAVEGKITLISKAKGPTPAVYENCLSSDDV